MTYYPTRIDVPPVVQIEVIDLLNQTLATTLDLKTQVKQAYWNIKSKQFYQMHKLLDKIATQLEEFLEVLAERVTALGGIAMGTVRTAACETAIPEYPFDILDEKDHVTAVADRMAPYAKALRGAIDQAIGLGDADTADLYTDISRKIDKYLWFLEAHLQAENRISEIHI